MGEVVLCPMSWASAKGEGALLSRAHIPTVWLGKHSPGLGGRVRGQE